MAAMAASVTVFVTHSNLASMNAEVKLATDMTVGQLRDKLYRMTGTAPSAQALTLQDASGEPVASLDDDDRALAFFPLSNGMLLHIVDTDPSSISAGGALENTEGVEKFTLSKEKYESAGGADFRKFRDARRKKGAVVITEDFQAEEAKALEVGSRCQLKKTGRRGTIKYVGKVPELKRGFWVGVHLDEPTGKNDGSVKGTRYFECPANSGAFARPSAVEQGDFPEIDILAELDDEDDL